jgi:predicted transcriptional regulator of viral defense system
MEKFKKARKLFIKNKGVLRTSTAIKLGIHPKTLYAMLKQGYIELLARGVYKLTELPEFSNTDFIAVTKRIPSAVICLISALSYYEITTQMPHAVDIAIPLKSFKPKLDYPFIRVFRYSEKSFKNGVKKVKIDGVGIRIYSIEKTLADCFKYRNKIGPDVVMEALKLAFQRKKIDIHKLLHYAELNRCNKIMKPYIEMVAHE